MNFKIRSYNSKDVDAVYEVCLKTGDGGDDGTHLYDDPSILGHIYVGPYVTIAPELAFVLEDSQGVCGYVFGALESGTFYKKLIEQWLPDIQKQVPNPKGKPESWTPSERLYYEVHHPSTYLPDALIAYPSHLHIDLIPRAQRQGNGTRLMQTLLKALKDKGSPAVHLGMNPANERALKFYVNMGFSIIDSAGSSDTLYLGRQL